MRGAEILKVNHEIAARHGAREPVQSIWQHVNPPKFFAQAS